MKKIIYFDMDGTIADLYGVKGWLEAINAEDATPYKVAEPLPAIALAKEFEEKGYEIGVITWLAKGATKEYNKVVRKVKRDWIAKNLPQATEIHIVKYGTPKYKVAKNKNGILVDDEEPNRKAWKGIAINPNK